MGGAIIYQGADEPVSSSFGFWIGAVEYYAYDVVCDPGKDSD
jgi:hypothetical protein